MSAFQYQSGSLHVEAVALTAIAERYGTPCYVYSRRSLEDNFHRFDTAFAGTSHLVCYAVKANSNLAILNLLSRWGCGFDIVSGGELRRVIAAGGDPTKTVFSGVGKTAAEIEFALRHGVLCFNVESSSELARIQNLAAQLKTEAPISIRVNPDVDPRTHPYTSTGLKENKFGVAYEDAYDLYREAARAPNLRVVGIAFHLGSIMMDSDPIIAACEKTLALVDRLEAAGIPLRHIDVGGGLGIPYRVEDKPVDLSSFSATLKRLIQGRPQRLLFEPGRYLVGDAGVLLTRVEYLKTSGNRNFAIVDAAMNDLLRPALYDAYHEVKAVITRDVETRRFQIVGPVCESADFLGHDRDLRVHEGDLLAICNGGAYGMTMSSNYNSRPRAAEIMVDNTSAHLIREREDADQLFARERVLP